MDIISTKVAKNDKVIVASGGNYCRVHSPFRRNAFGGGTRGLKSKNVFLVPHPQAPEIRDSISPIVSGKRAAIPGN